jgi:hypothetical protein
MNLQLHSVIGRPRRKESDDFPSRCRETTQRPERILTDAGKHLDVPRSNGIWMVRFLTDQQ